MHGSLYRQELVVLLYCSYFPREGWLLSTIDCISTPIILRSCKQGYAPSCKGKHQCESPWHWLLTDSIFIIFMSDWVPRLIWLGSEFTCLLWEVTFWNTRNEFESACIRCFWWKSLCGPSQCFGASSLDCKAQTNRTYFSTRTQSFTCKMFILEMNNSLLGGMHEQALTTIFYSTQEPTYKPS